MREPERDLQTLLNTLSVQEHEGLWGFEVTETDAPLPGSIFQFREREGWSQIRPAKASDEAENLWVWLELSVYSDLHAVGFIAHVSAALARANLPCNIVAAFHHDHLFVPARHLDRALTVLNTLGDNS